MSIKGDKGNIPYNNCVVGVGCDNCNKGDMILDCSSKYAIS